MAHPSPLRWRALGIIALAQFLVIMDTSIIGVALPEFGADLGFAQADLSWVFNAYIIAFGGLLLLGGKLSDVIADLLEIETKKPCRRGRIEDAVTNGLEDGPSRGTGRGACMREGLDRRGAVRQRIASALSALLGIGHRRRFCSSLLRVPATSGTTVLVEEVAGR